LFVKLTTGKSILNIGQRGQAAAVVVAGWLASDPTQNNNKN